MDLEQELAARGLDTSGLRADLEARLQTVLDQEAARAEESPSAAGEARLSAAEDHPGFQPTAQGPDIPQSPLPEDLNSLTKPQVWAGRRFHSIPCRPKPCK